MSSRHKIRQQALQILFLWDVRQQPVEDAMAAYFGTLTSEERQTQPPDDPFLPALVYGVTSQVGEIDRQISKHAEHWRLERMPTVDRNVLRLAVYELTQTGIPAPVVIDEALELARRFSNEESVHFVNGVLDAIRRDLGIPEPTGPPVAPD